MALFRPLLVLIRLAIGLSVLAALYIYGMSFLNMSTPHGIQSWDDAKLNAYALVGRRPPRSEEESRRRFREWIATDATRSVLEAAAVSASRGGNSEDAELDESEWGEDVGSPGVGGDPYPLLVKAK